MTWILTWLAVLLFTWQAPELTQFKQIAYEFNSTLSWESIYDTKKCKTELSAIAYAFAMKETGNWKWLSKQRWRNNLFWLRYWTDNRWVKFLSYGYPKWKRNWANSTNHYTPNWYNNYKSKEDSIYDFMSMFYQQWCNLTVKYVARYKNWSKWWMWWAQEYYNQLQKHIKYYNNLKFRVKLIK